jgi:MYXO-CTERM domain-containing protein
MTPRKALLIVATLAAPLFVAYPSLAQTCTTDADCGPGLSCQAAGTVTKSCPVGGDCTLDGTPTVVMACQPAPCTSDANCGSGMVCGSQTTTTCSGSTGAPVKCDPAAGCEAVPTPPPEETCTTSTRSFCAYRWQLPCNADVDCGDGFVCQPSVMGTCSGGTPVDVGSTGTGTTGSAGTSSGTASGGSSSSGTGGAAGTAPTPSTPDTGVTTTPVCTTTTYYPGSCQPKAKTCAVDSDCPSTWTCASIVSGSDGTAGRDPMPVDGGATTEPAPTGEPPIMSSDPIITRVCQSPTGYPTRGGLPEDGTGSVSLGTDQASKGADAGTAGGAGSTPPPTPSVPATDDDTNTAKPTGATTGGGGCSVSGASHGSNVALWLGLVGLLALRGWRRGRPR